MPKVSAVVPNLQYATTITFETDFSKIEVLRTPEPAPSRKNVFKDSFECSLREQLRDREKFQVLIESSDSNSPGSGLRTWTVKLDWSGKQNVFPVTRSSD